LLEVPLPDTFISSLVSAYDGATVLTVTLALAAGDSVTLALDDDVLFDPGYPPAEFGTGLAVDVVRVVVDTTPVPTLSQAGQLLLTALLVLAMLSALRFRTGDRGAS
jgi:hypothetical protein